MEHIIQFGVNIDDDAIRREVVRLATREIIEDLKKECRKELGLTGSSYSRSKFVDSMVDGILADCREQVVREAASALADKAPKQKWYREMMSSAVEEVETDGQERKGGHRDDRGVGRYHVRRPHL